MRRIDAQEAAELNLPTHEHHDLPDNKIILDRLKDSPGVWFHLTWEEVGGVGNVQRKIAALREDSEFRSWTMHDHIIPGNRDGGLYVMRDLLN